MWVFKILKEKEQWALGGAFGPNEKTKYINKGGACAESHWASRVLLGEGPFETYNVF